MTEKPAGISQRASDPPVLHPGSEVIISFPASPEVVEPPVAATILPHGVLPATSIGGKFKTTMATAKKLNPGTAGLPLFDFASQARTTAVNGRLLEVLAKSATYKKYKHAFSAATGMPLALRSAESWQLPDYGRPGENNFCTLMAAKSKTCAACLQMQDELTRAALEKSKTLTCHFGFTETAVPVRLGQQAIGFLQTGQVLSRAPSAAGFKRVTRQVRDLGVDVDAKKLRTAYFQTRVVPEQQMEAIATLLEYFAELLSVRSNQIAVHQDNAELPAIVQAREFMERNHQEKISLGSTARAVHLSRSYFCKLFRKFTGQTFTTYLSRLRIESAKNLLLNPNLRVSEVAFEVGFQSLTHFNRVFVRMAGESPTDYRRQLAVATAAPVPRIARR